MTRERIEQIRESKERARLNQYKEFQASGNSKSYTRMKAHEDVVELCDLALGTIDDHNEIVHIKAAIISFAGDAEKLLHYETYISEDVQKMLKELIATAEMYGFRRKWS